MTRKQQRPDRFRRLSLALLAACILLPLVYFAVGRRLSGFVPQTNGQAALFLLYRAPAAEVLLLTADVVLLQKAAVRGLRHTMARLGLAAAVLTVYVLIHTAHWFLG